MKRNCNIIILMMSLWLFSCINKKNENNVNADSIANIQPDIITLKKGPIAIKLKEEKKIIKIDIPALLSFYEEIDSFPFHMPYDAGLYDYTSKNEEFKGKDIPLRHCTIFDSSLYVSEEYSQSGIFAVRSFKIDSGLIGLLTRRPSDISSIGLYLLDTNKKAIINS